VAWEIAWAEAALVRRFVERLSQLNPAEVEPVVRPVLQRDPYLSAWTNVEAALGNVPEADRGRLAGLLAELDSQLARLPLSPDMAEAARRAVRGLLARRWPLAEASLRFIYEPFESLIPLSSLSA
jgi:hypothetical protein